jgi:hypothetical protein
MKRSTPIVVASAVMALMASCVGKVGDGSGSTGTGTGTTPKPDAEGNLPYVAPQALTAALPARVWRLTHAEYRQSLRDFVGMNVDTSGFEAENDSGTFLNVSNVAFVRTLQAANYFQTAEQVADSLSDAQLRSLAGTCGNLTTACKADFIRTAVGRAFRRPPSAEDMTELGEVFDIGVASGDPLLPFRGVVQVLLTSPGFLYRTEVGAPEDAGKPTFRLTNHEVASLLSFSIIGQAPSPTLLAAADRGELTNLGSLPAHVGGLLDRPEAAAPLQTFLGQWLNLNRFNDDLYKFPDRFPGFDGVRTAMVDEAWSFLAAKGSMTGSLAELLTAPVPPATGALGTFYTAPGAGAGTRTGWLSLGAFLSVAAHSDISSPTLRGVFIRDRMLCQKFPVPEIVPALSDVESMGATPRSTRELYELHKTKTECAGCHNAIDPIGFTFENFDGAGRYRTTELFRNQTTPVPVDTTGRLINTDVNRALANHTELAQALAQSDWVRECAAIQAFRYYFGFGADVPRGLPPVMAGYQALKRGANMKDLVVAVMTSPSTIERTRN